MREKAVRLLVAVLLSCGMLGSGAVSFAATEKPEIFPQLGHALYVNSVAFSPDGKFALSGSFDNTMRLWNVATGKEMRCFSGHTAVVASVAFSPDGRYALSGSWDKTLRLWDVKTGKHLRRIVGHKDMVDSVTFSPDGQYALSGSKDKTLRLWDVTTGKNIRSFDGHKDTVNSVAFSPDGKFALSGSEDKTLRLWDVATGKEIRSFTGHTDCVRSVAFSPDGRLALSGGGTPQSDNTMRLWDVATGKELRSFAGHTSNVNSVTFSPDGRFALSGSGKILFFGGKGNNESLRLWDVATGKEVRRFEGHTSYVNFVAFSPDGRLALLGGGTPQSDNTMLLWDVAKWKKIRSFAGHKYAVASVAFSPDGHFALSGSFDSTTRLWDVSTGRELVQLISFTDGEWVTITPEGYFNASPGGAKHLNVRVGNNVYGIDQFYSRFYRPELVELALAGKAIKATEDIGALAKRSPAPTVSLIAPTSDVSVNKETITVKVAVKDNGGGIGDILVCWSSAQGGSRNRQRSSYYSEQWVHRCLPRLWTEKPLWRVTKVMASSATSFWRA